MTNLWRRGVRKKQNIQQQVEIRPQKGSQVLAMNITNSGVDVVIYGGA